MRLGIIAAIILSAIVMASEPNKTTKTTDASTQQEGASSLTLVNNYNSPAKADEPNNDSPHWYTSLKRPEWWLVIIGGITFVAIWWQAKKTADATQAMRDSIPHQKSAAEAADKNATALANAERAWLTVKVGDVFTGEIHMRYAKVPIKNTGRTPARIVRIVVTSKLIPFPKDGWGRPGELPTEFTLGSSNHTMEVDGRDFVIPPGGEHMMYASIFDDEWKTLTKKIEDGKQSWYVYGFVEYLDTIEGKKQHKTGFCEIYWPPEEGGAEVEAFRFTANLIPAAYICAT